MSPDAPSLLQRPVAALDSARAAAEAAATAAGVRIETPRDLSALVAATEVWRRIWTPDGTPLISTEMLRALTHVGNYLSVARRGDGVVGALLGFFGGNGRVDLLHSHILGVDPAARGGGVAYALKLHQRAWALERGISRVTWTYDPLVRRNGHLNLSKLGARGVDYLVAFYGAMPDAINNGDDSDRVLVEWDLAAAAAGRTAPVHDVESLLRRGAAVVLHASPGQAPALQENGDADILLCATPADIVALRHDDPACARQWRACVRAVMVAGMERGMTLSGMARGGWYVLSRCAL
ncbi:MAG TPA: GNAT family N-acetyltransferase [Candidatus Dormibacteraeota bacterium]|jgi:predicted GNAT superfamily acetyltransferase|nr:GNAT family N-acetyltransferase [Candidatus Dormibacteraeota bacterium]